MNFVLLYITTKNREQARSIGCVLLESHLVACINIIDGMQSVYWWNNQICEDTEAILIAKTRETNTDAVISRVKELHTYSCPCIVSLPILNGNPDYLKWLEEQTC
ncbi:MAG: divalent-cation tolerance protein CutA [Fibrobacter sp.]|nr:divalent-cation tolerance protein CutA [Fibrobacter sp.]